MKLLKADLWSSKDPIIGVTTNAYIRKDGCLVMGRGSALEGASKYPNLQKHAGMMIAANGNKYGWLVTPDKIGLFQVKYTFWQKADLNLIEFSTNLLNRYVNEFNINVSINYPGIGFGGLKKEEVEPIIKNLDDRVTVYYK